MTTVQQHPGKIQEHPGLPGNVPVGRTPTTQATQPGSCCHYAPLYPNVAAPAALGILGVVRDRHWGWLILSTIFSFRCISAVLLLIPGKRWRLPKAEYSFMWSSCGCIHVFLNACFSYVWCKCSLPTIGSSFWRGNMVYSVWRGVQEICSSSFNWCTSR